MKRILTTLGCIMILGFSAAAPLFAVKVVTVTIPSLAMNTEIETVIIAPDSSEERLPVLYLLHGYGCGKNPARAWLTIQPDLKAAAEKYGIIIVCPDGKEFWYLDSPVDTQIRYETFITEELVSYIDSNYSTRPDAHYRMISGFDMGGYGAVRLAARHHSIFAVAGSTSGMFDISVKTFPQNPFDGSPNKDFNLTAVLGAYNKNTRKPYSLLEYAETIRDSKIALIIDCGTEDSLVYADNENFHKKLTASRVPHDWITRPGGHDKAYWANSIEYHLLFFTRHIVSFR